MLSRAKALWLPFFCTLIAVITICFTGNSRADEAKFLADNPALEAQVMNIAVDLRCLVCQNETIAGSHADLAIDLRNQIRDQLQQGKSKQDIIDYMVARYGDFVLYNPPLKKNTLFLWLGPFALLVIGFTILLRHIRREQQLTAPLVNSSTDIARARELLKKPQKELE